MRWRILVIRREGVGVYGVLLGGLSIIELVMDDCEAPEDHTCVVVFGDQI